MKKVHLMSWLILFFSLFPSVLQAQSYNELWKEVEAAQKKDLPKTVIGKKNAYIAMFDRWKKKDLEDSRYVWLPVLVKDGKITIPWHEKWNLSIFDK